MKEAENKTTIYCDSSSICNTTRTTSHAKKYNKCTNGKFAKLIKRILNINRPTIAYSRSKNVGDYVTQAKIHQAPGRFASTIMGDLEQGLYPLSLPLFFTNFLSVTPSFGVHMH